MPVQSFIKIFAVWKISHEAVYTNTVFSFHVKSGYFLSVVYFSPKKIISVASNTMFNYMSVYVFFLLLLFCLNHLAESVALIVAS